MLTSLRQASNHRARSLCLVEGLGLGLSRPLAVHGLILPRRVSRFGWMGIERDLGNDATALKARPDNQKLRAASDLE